MGPLGGRSRGSKGSAASRLILCNGVAFTLSGISDRPPAKKRGGRPKGTKKATKKRSMSTEGRQRQIAAMKRFWAAKKAGTKKAAKKATKKRAAKKAVVNEA